MNKDYEYYKHKRVNSLQEILELSIKNGKDDIAFFYNGKDDNIIYKTYYEFYNDVTSLKKYFKDSNKVSFSFSNDEEIKMMTIIEIKSLFFIKCYYDRRNDRIDLYIPEYFYDIFKELVSDKNVNKVKCP